MKIMGVCIKIGYMNEGFMLDHKVCAMLTLLYIPFTVVAMVAMIDLFKVVVVSCSSEFDASCKSIPLLLVYEMACIQIL